MKKIMIMMAIIAIATTKLTFAQSKTDAAFNQVLTAYYDVKNALATDKKDVAAEKVKALSAKVEAIPHKDLPATQHTLWMEQAKIIKAKATELAAGKDIKAQRKSFEGISSAMIKTVRNIKFNNARVYVQHCPMAKASWLNEKENIENPYYGSMMFECGDVSETIKSN
ncbi:DUF3347 domain-containing protein [Pedobacter sp. MC2016-05]|uniref:DUF3347 domain-containing protein n=1 Tax=Pedobacter sp. MC2016-05 TaxID=2994474 RepID=UPI002248669F|nr:DUF3347 domain-containing protein [Pedobacter sp. MC2016-05]MCX2472939.1 DUF3347 domain-containing protein [Pedobacter sp. MC2016-05]